jgi:hypothetical protein
LPLAVGEKVTRIEQVPPAATLVPQLLLEPNSPVVATPLISKAALPVLVKVTVCEALVVPTAWEAENVKASVDREALGATVPTPVNEMVCGLLAAL